MTVGESSELPAGANWKGNSRWTFHRHVSDGYQSMHPRNVRRCLYEYEYCTLVYVQEFYIDRHTNRHTKNETREVKYSRMQKHNKARED